MKEMSFALNLLTAAFLFPACTLQARSSPQVIEDLVNIRFQTDVRVFAAMAAINAAGFDLDAGDLDRNPVRRLVRERLALVDPDLRARLQQSYGAHNTERADVDRQGKYVSFALVVKGPPEFSLPARLEQIPFEVRSLVGFETLLAELWRQADLASLWDQVRPTYVREVEAYRPLLRKMIIDTLRYMHTEARVALDRQIVFIPDLLNAYGVVNARVVENDYYVFVGPSRSQERPLRSLRHEYLHFLLDPLVAKYYSDLPAPEPYLTTAQAQPHLHADYGTDFTILVTESLIQMVELRLDGETGGRLMQRIVDACERGLVLAPYFEERLEIFEKSRDELQVFFPGMIRGIGSDSLSRRDESIAQAKKELPARAAREITTRAEEPVRPAEVRSLLGRANQLLAGRDFDGAAPLLERVLQIDPLNANALFGAAQIAAQSQDFERALTLYEKAAANAGTDAWIAAWSRVRRGNIYRFLGDREKARAEWSRALNLQGNLRGADEAARKLLAHQEP
jgi:predicted negative regulator of RcsB-dependent stress response